ncbi:type III polyketide synthase [Geomonas sp. Red69]|uniref:Type III polyketide synthase n=1 Tax=Geomonas diazotrophica TaxID=2843197 RepID=A0ABX8JMA8_9BACT|nr:MULTISPECIES: type III polyketide synthase [Geomonas]MBU5637851.1 type III polyketide synthase [Geomonas diazotrophica]QWV96570.1 type III polyketide synthase [Geomonas nitrogeniifigens]
MTDALTGGQPPSGRTYVASIASAVPRFSASQRFAADLVREHFKETLTPRSMGLIRATFEHPSIEKRHFAVDDPVRIFDETQDQRVARFTEESVNLAAQAVTRALEKVGLSVQEVKGLVVNTCTGYICPGISTYLAQRLGLDPRTRLYDLVGSGCGGAIPNLQVAESMLRMTGGVVVSVAVEICSAAFQMGNDLSLILSNALFGDGAAAAVLWERPEGFELHGSAGRYVPEQREAIRFVHKGGQLHNQLSTDLPRLVGKAAAEVVDDLLAGSALNRNDIGWALHTGGEKVINAVRDEVGIPEDRLRATRKVLSRYGNMSSPTVWFVLDEMLREGMPSGEWCVMLAYGAGLSAHACLLRKI